ncbi:MAG: endonuclease MutS2 [Ignavibacteria bacterium]|jgi:DNA mismatch repair protein MutS2|nr:endonuclease MutS2 [Ignavibacteria bacterium]MCU7501578.1 endonuclease MutS2 [Ignavibacteria bacterium]MCU7517115.1 endonuclease MutS2 [Ignavibacteria bacterium]
MISKSVLEKLEFPKILQFISRYAYTEGGKKEVFRLEPLESLQMAKLEGSYVTEATEILIKNDFPPISYLPELREDLSRSAIEGAVLTNKSILDILTLAETSRKLFQFLKAQTGAHNINSSFLELLFVDKVFEHHISRIIDENGDLRDNASQKLNEIREEIRHKTDTLGKVINRILKDLSDSYLVRDDYVTQRDGRMVVPVKSEHKRHVKGFIHAESSSGQTVYIEPEETLELNNEILSLNFAEKREIERILRELTKKVGQYSPRLKESLEAVSSLDSIFARAKYSLEIIGSFPTLEKDQPLRLMDARHPLLLKKLGRAITVPLNLEVSEKNVILITGPNAGGKTVVLKTTGILAIMALSGIPIPAGPDSNLHFFDEILLDIGDQQSIEDDLSTFSSHLSNIKHILDSAGEDSLVLLDEIGTGTDPAEGAALATAILVTLQKNRAIVLATTHHGSLKIIANEQPGFENASMEFDNERLVPTYSFNQGLPGSSYAFEVAERIGLGKEFLNMAKGYLDSDKMKVEDFLVELEKRSRALEQKLRTSEIENSRLKGLANLYQANLERIEAQKKEILLKAKSSADDYLKDVNRKVEQAIRQIKESNAKSESIKEAKKEIEELKNENKKLIPQPVVESIDKNHIFTPGEFAQLKNSQTAGKVIEVDSEKNRAILLVGNIKIQVKLDELLPAKRKEAEPRQEYSRSSFQTPAANVRIDIRGQKPEEAEFEVVRFLDNANSAGLERVEILHGKGTGVLKRMVKEILTKHDQVDKFYHAAIEQGGDGVTIVELK